MKFGVFDHMDRGPLPLNEQYENRLKLIEAYEQRGIYCYHLAEHHARRSAWRRRRASFSPRSRRAPNGCASGRSSTHCRMYHPLRAAPKKSACSIN